jgi:hypothetical protein
LASPTRLACGSVLGEKYERAISSASPLPSAAVKKSRSLVRVTMRDGAGTPSRP